MKLIGYFTDDSTFITLAIVSSELSPYTIAELVENLRLDYPRIGNNIQCYKDEYLKEINVNFEVHNVY